MSTPLTFRATSVESYFMNAGVASAWRAISASSYADSTWPSAGRPFGTLATTS